MNCIFLCCLVICFYQIASFRQIAGTGGSRSATTFYAAKVSLPVRAEQLRKDVGEASSDLIVRQRLLRKRIRDARVIDTISDSLWQRKVSVSADVDLLDNNNLLMDSPVDFAVKDKLDKYELLPFIGSILLAAGASTVSHSALPLEASAVLESLFYSYCSLLVKTKMQNPKRYDSNDGPQDWTGTWEKVFASVEDPREWFHSWFLEGSFEDITRQDAEEFLAWAMFSTTLEYLSPEEMEVLRGARRQVERLTQTAFSERAHGATPMAMMRSTIEPLQFFPKPLLFYAITQGLLGLGMQRGLRGYRKYKSGTGDFTFYMSPDIAPPLSEGAASSESGEEGFWFKRRVSGFGSYVSGLSGRSGSLYGSERVFQLEAPTGTSDGTSDLQSQEAMKAKKVPLVFYHGVGGLPWYVSFLKRLEALGLPVIAMEMPYVSLRVAPEVPDSKAHVKAFSDMLDAHGYDRAFVVGHSWGSNVLSWVVQATPDRVAGALFLDPVVFMLHLRDITWSWFYKNKVEQKEREPGWRNLIQLDDIYPLLKTELFGVHAIQRSNYWFRNVLWPQELEAKPFDTMVVVSQDDKIVPAQSIEEKLQAHVEQTDVLKGYKGASRLGVEMMEGAEHGSFVFEAGYQDRVIGILMKQYAKVVQVQTTEEMSEMNGMETRNRNSARAEGLASDRPIEFESEAALV